jgi:hypothetical protein
MNNKSPRQQLAAFLAKYTPEVAGQARKVLARMRTLMPGAVELVYDNYNFLVIGFGPTERPSEAIFSIILAPRWVTLCFLHGAKLNDPWKRLKGGGNQVRNIRLKDESTLDEPVVQALMTQAMENGPVPFEGGGKGKLIIKSISKSSGRGERRLNSVAE